MAKLYRKEYVLPIHLAWTQPDTVLLNIRDNNIKINLTTSNKYGEVCNMTYVPLLHHPAVSAPDPVGIVRFNFTTSFRRQYYDVIQLQYALQLPKTPLPHVCRDYMTLTYGKVDGDVILSQSTRNITVVPFDGTVVGVFSHISDLHSYSDGEWKKKHDRCSKPGLYCISLTLSLQWRPKAMAVTRALVSLTTS